MSRRCPVLDLVAELATWLEIADDDHPEDATDLDLVRFAVDQVGDDPETVERVSDETLKWASTDEGHALGLGLLYAIRHARVEVTDPIERLGFPSASRS